VVSFKLQPQSAAIIEQYAALAPQPASALWRREKYLFSAGTRNKVLLFLVPQSGHYTIYAVPVPLCCEWVTIIIFQIYFHRPEPLHILQILLAGSFT
jgi:hypothetical protein